MISKCSSLVHPVITELIIISLQKQYIKHAKSLQRTSSGISHDSDDDASDADEGAKVVMDFYIPPDGPDALTVICQGCNKDLWSWRSKYKSYEALRGCNLGVRDRLQVWCRVKTVGLRGSVM